MTDDAVEQRWNIIGINSSTSTEVLLYIENIADEAIIMQQGKIIKKGKISDLCKNAGKEMTLEEAFLHNINQDSCEGIVL